jgi:hypothetical protein
MAKLIVYDDSPGPPGGSTGVTAALVGVLSFEDVAVHKRAIKDLLTRAHAVVLDVAELRIQHGPAVQVLSTALLAAGGWPSARLVVVRPDGRLATALRTTGVARDVHIADSVEDALGTLHIRPARVSRRIWLGPDAAARRAARTMINAVCHDWHVAHLVPGARTVVRELVDCTVERSRAPGVLKVSLDDSGLRIAVRDFQPVEPGSPVLDRMATVSESCGVTPLSDGKIVWAVLANAATR